MFLQDCKASVADLSDLDKTQAETFRDFPAKLMGKNMGKNMGNIKSRDAFST